MKTRGPRNEFLEVPVNRFEFKAAEQRRRGRVRETSRRSFRRRKRRAVQVETDGIVLDVRNLTKDFTDLWGRPTVRALQDLTLQVRRGEVFGLLGPNGSGKTTTIKLVLGLLFPTAGVIEVLSASPRDVEAKRRIGYLPEESYLHRFLTAEETLDFYGRLFDLPRAERRRRAAELLKQVGLEHARRRTVREYSKGMVRRLGLAQALINNPDFVLLDEPTSGMDPIGAREIKEVIRRLREQGKTVLLSSHLLADVEDLCDRIAILHKGTLRVAGRVEELLEAPDTLELTVRGLAKNAGAALSAAAERLGGEVIGVRRRRERLEELFLRTVGAAPVASLAPATSLVPASSAQPAAAATAAVATTTTAGDETSGNVEKPSSPAASSEGNGK